MKSRLIVHCVAALVAAGLTQGVANADPKDAWITTKAKIALLTRDGLSVKSAHVETIDGNVTLHGKVATEGDRIKAAKTVLAVSGVNSVRNLLQVVPEGRKDAVAMRDSEIKQRVKSALKGDKRIEDVKVESVNNGVVLLTGKTRAFELAQLAVRNAYTVGGVRHVACEIETGED